MSNSSENNQRKSITVALAGNPNCGKTTIFNNLTGARQHVGNYGGVTVDTKEGFFKHGQYDIKVVDLPGTYSLTAYSIEEIVTRNYILNDKPDVVINVVDGTNLQRNLYLTAQLKELNVPMILVLNMFDEMQDKGIDVDLNQMSDSLASPVVPTVGSRNKGTDKLIDMMIAVANTEFVPNRARIHYGDEIEDELEKITAVLNQCNSCGDKILNHCPHWTALKLLEKDKDIIKHVKNEEVRQKIQEQVAHSHKRLYSLFGDDPDVLIAEQRYGYVKGLTAVSMRMSPMKRNDISDMIDKVLTNRILGLPIFGLLMFLTFWMVFAVGKYPMEWIEQGQETLISMLRTKWSIEYMPLLRSLVIDGVIAGVGGVLVFVPNIVLLFFGISLLEDTGYMARAAFIMDRMMKWVGLHGKSFIPMLTGFGCTVPGIMATRILDNKRDRLTTILVLPLMSCGARLPIYVMISSAFFPKHQTVAMFSIYVIGIVIAVVLARLLRSTLFKGQPSPFVMELPPYRIPTATAISLHVWQRAGQYIKKAGTVILAFSILMWVLLTFPRIPEQNIAGMDQKQAHQAQLQYSITGRIGKAVEPVVKPMGFDWKIGTAIVGAFPAKELFVTQMGIVFSLGETEADSPELASELRSQYSPLTGFCIMLFCLISMPCMATVAVTKRETGSWGWAVFQLAGLTIIAWLVTTGVYQIATALNNWGL
ncbi:MAG: ferrous iron transport protein B [Phycisphaerae bacterium]|nr:ferrous iron transport protein B [Phycisphaerae bacterium]